LLDGSGVEEAAMGFEVGGERRNTIRGWVCGRWGHAVFKVSWGRQIVSAKMGGRVEKKEVGMKIFCTHVEGMKNIYCKFDGKKEEGTEWEVYKRGLPLITY
jgi:hypothetical protein